MPRPTTAKILTELADAGIITSWSRTRRQDEDRPAETSFRVVSTRVRISHEIYGQNAQMYFVCSEDEAIVQAVQTAVRAAGGEVDTAWMGRERFHCFSAGVSYFKGPRWWE